MPPSKDRHHQRLGSSEFAPARLSTEIHHLTNRIVIVIHGVGLLSGVGCSYSRVKAWIVDFGMALLRDRSIDEVVHHLALVLPALKGRPEVNRSAVIQARDRLGCEPLAVLSWLLQPAPSPYDRNGRTT